MRVNVDSIALTDARFRRLGRALGMDWHGAFGRCVAVWMTATDRKSELLQADDIDIAADREGFAAAMIAADLAEGQPGGAVRVRGIRERIQYLRDQSERARRRWGRGSATEPPKADANAHANAEANADAKADANAHASSPDPDPDLSPDPDQAPERERRARESASPPAVTPSPPPLSPVTPTVGQAAGMVPAICTPAAERTALIHDAWTAARTEHERLRAAIDPNARPWPPVPMGHDVVARVTELAEKLGIEGAREMLANRLASAVAEAERKRAARELAPLEYFTFASYWAERQFERGAAASPEQVRRPRTARGAPAASHAGQSPSGAAYQRFEREPERQRSAEDLAAMSAMARRLAGDVASNLCDRSASDESAPRRPAPGRPPLAATPRADHAVSETLKPFGDA